MIKRSGFIIILLVTQLGFIGLSINKQSRWVKTMYTQQLLEKEQTALLTKKQNLINQLSSLHNKNLLKQDALAKGLEPLTLSQTKKILL